MTEYRSIPELFFAAARRGGDSPRYMARRDGRYVTTSWRECHRNVEETAAGLIELGLAPNDRVAILSATRPEWTECDVAALAAGCVTIPVYPSNLPDECGYLLINSGARTVLAENPDQAAKIKEVVNRGIEVDGRAYPVIVDHIVLFEGDLEGCSTLSRLREQGRRVLEERRADIAARTEAIDRDTTATIVYTSGTTGLPKGVIQTHGNHLAAVSAIGMESLVEPGEIDFSFLPLAHSFGRMVEYLALDLGSVTAYAERIDTILTDLAETRPHFMPAVPRILEKVYAGVQRKRGQGGMLQRAIFDWAVSVGKRRAEYVNCGEPVPAGLSLLDSVAHRLVFSKIQAIVGGRMRFLVSGGAPLAAEINEFFHACGLPVLEGYGLTETTPILTCNLPGRTRIGTVGRPVRDVELMIAPDGEILAKGPNVAQGYHERPAETAEAWDAAGWFHTGDIGELEDGYLRITDRKKELIKTAGGKYVAPQKIENLLKSRPLISQAVVIGDRLKYCVALLTLDPDALVAWASERGVEPDLDALVADPGVRATVEESVAAVNERLASYESIKYFELLPCDFSVESGELTPSLKIKRKVIAERYADVIADLASH